MCIISARAAGLTDLLWSIHELLTFGGLRLHGKHQNGVDDPEAGPGLARNKCVQALIAELPDGFVKQDAGAGNSGKFP